MRRCKRKVADTAHIASLERELGIGANVAEAVWVDARVRVSSSDYVSPPTDWQDTVFTRVNTRFDGTELYESSDQLSWRDLSGTYDTWEAELRGFVPVTARLDFTHAVVGVTFTLHPPLQVMFRRCEW